MQTKVCARCHREQPTSQYYKRKQLIDGLSSYCKACWKELNDERKKEMYQQQAEYRKEHIEKRRRRYRKYWLENRQEILARKRKRYQEQKKEAANAASKT